MQDRKAIIVIRATGIHFYESSFLLLYIELNISLRSKFNE